MESPKRSRRSKEDEDIELDSGLWGQLQDYIPLVNVYEKLPHVELFRLRVVCKAWNDVTLQRLEPKPYFVIVTGGTNDDGDDLYLHGVLSYDAASHEHSFKRQHFTPGYSYEVEVEVGARPFEVEGLLFCHHPHTLKEQGVFNIHNKTWHAIPPAPQTSKYNSATGMVVDTSKRPYSFKLVVGSLDTETQIYDSESRLWTTTSSRLMPSAKWALKGYPRVVNCMCSNGCVYISIGPDILLMYSMEEDKWTDLEFPEVLQDDEYACTVHDLGVWDGRIFTTREDCERGNVTVWELVDQTKQEWVKYVVISGADYRMLWKCDFANNGPSIYEGMKLVPCFCDGYLLLYMWDYFNGQSYSLGMLNLATYEWEEVDLPPRTVIIKGGSGEGDGASWKSLGIDDSSEEDEDSKSSKGSESQDSDTGYAPKAIRIRRKPARSKNRHPGVGAALDTSGGISAKATKGTAGVKPPPEGAAGVKPRLAAEAAILESTTGMTVQLTSGDKFECANLESTTGKTVQSTSFDKFECAMCFFESNVLGDYEAHKKTKVHRVLEVLQIKDKKKINPLIMLNDYVTHNHLKVNYEITNKMVNSICSFEVIAIVGGGSGATAGLSAKGVGMDRKRQRAKHMAAADFLEKIMENVLESEFMNMARIGFGIWGRKRKGDGGNAGGSAVGVGVGGGAGRNPGDSGGHGTGVGESIGTSGGNVGSSSCVGGGVGGELGGISAGCVGADVFGGGTPGDSGGCGTGVGGGRGSYLSKPNAAPVTAYNDDSPRGGNLSTSVDKHSGQGGPGYTKSWQGGRGGMPSRPEICTERKLEKLTESYIDRIRGGQGYEGGGNDRRESFGAAVGIGSSSYGGQHVGGIGHVGRQPLALGHGGCGLHPGISVYGHQSHVPLVPHIIGHPQHMPIQDVSSLSRPRHQLSAQYISRQHSFTQHVHAQQATMWNSTVAGPGQGGTQYHFYDTAPGTGQMPIPTINYDANGAYAPYDAYAPHDAYAINQEYVGNPAVAVQEMAPGTSNARQSTLVAYYGVVQPQQPGSQQRVQLENNNVLAIGGTRKREEHSHGAQLRHFHAEVHSPSDSNLDKIAATCEDGVLTVTVPKIPPPQPSKPRTIEVTMCNRSS